MSNDTPAVPRVWSRAVSPHSPAELCTCDGSGGPRYHCAADALHGAGRNDDLRARAEDAERRLEIVTAEHDRLRGELAAVSPDTVRPTGPECYAEAVGMPEYCAGTGCARDVCFPPDTVRPDDDVADAPTVEAAPGPWWEMLTEQTCPASRHATWYVDSEHHHACPWCSLDEARAAVRSSPDGE